MESTALFEDLLSNPASSIARALNRGEQPWQTSDYLLAHVYQALTGEPHPGLPKRAHSLARSPERQVAISRALERKRERERAIAAGEIT